MTLSEKVDALVGASTGLRQKHAALHQAIFACQTGLANNVSAEAWAILQAALETAAIDLEEYVGWYNLVAPSLLSEIEWAAYPGENGGN